MKKHKNGKKFKNFAIFFKILTNFIEKIYNFASIKWKIFNPCLI